MDQDHAATIRITAQKLLDTQGLTPHNVGALWTLDKPSKSALVVLSYLLKSELVDALRALDTGAMQLLSVEGIENAVIFENCEPVLKLDGDQTKAAKKTNTNTLSIVAHAGQWRCTCNAFALSLLFPRPAVNEHDNLRVDATGVEEQIQFGGAWTHRVPSCYHLVAAWLSVNKHIQLPVRTISPAQHAQLVFNGCESDDTLV